MMISDIRQKHLKPVVGTEKTYIGTVNFDWFLMFEGSPWKLTVKKNTPFDVSVPKLLRWLVCPHNPKLLVASAFHDELLNLKSDKASASSEFRRILKALGYGAIKSWTFFFATLVWTEIAQKLRNFKEAK